MTGDLTVPILAMLGVAVLLAVIASQQRQRRMRRLSLLSTMGFRVGVETPTVTRQACERAEVAVTVTSSLDFGQESVH